MHLRGVLPWLFGSCLVVGCTPQASRDAVSISPSSPSAVVEAPAKRAATLPIHAIAGLPSVSVEANGLPLDLIVDTGANAHVLVGPALALAGGGPGRTATGTDSSGAFTGALAEGVHMEVDGRSLDPLFTVRDSPITSIRAAGVIAPLAWADEGVRIDLARGALSIGDVSEPDHAASFEGRLTRCSAEQLGAPTATVEVEIGGVTAILELDTGSTTTSIYADSAAGQHLARAPHASTDETMTATGTLHVQRYPGVEVRAGAARRTLTINVHDGSDTTCIRSDGVLGMDMLSGCMLDFRGERLAARCDPEAVPLSPLPAREDRVRIERVKVEPACGVDQATLDRASHPVKPWFFRDWIEIIEAIQADSSTIDLRHLKASPLLVTAACLDEGAKPPVYAFGWTRGDAGLVMHFENVLQP